ncbi:MAG: hypothetical protein U0893_28055 [Chloroflexota bacterium]
MEKQMDVELPDNLTLNYRGSGFEIVRKWLGWKTILLTVAALFWDGVLLPFWYRAVFGSGDVTMAVVFFALFHGTAGVGMTYAALAGWFNTTRIVVDQGKVTVRHGPVPWLGNKDLDATSFKKIYTEEVVYRSRHGTTVSFTVGAITVTGKDEKLVGGLEYEQAFIIEQEIERHFHIEDAPVRDQIA